MQCEFATMFLKKFMNKKTVIIIFTFISVLLTLVLVKVATGIIRQNLNQNLINDYSNKELSVALQTSTSLQNQVVNITEQMQTLALIPEINNGTTEECNQRLQQIAKQITTVSNIGRVGLDKKFRCTLNKALQGSDASKLGPYIDQIFNDPQHTPVMSRLIKLPSGFYAVAVHIPVYDKEGNFSGTLGGAIYFDQLRDKFLKNIKLSDKSYIVLEDDNGDILYHPDLM